MSDLDQQLLAEAEELTRRLVGSALPHLSLVDHNDVSYDVATLGTHTVLFVYPATGVPDRDPATDPAPGWDDIAGASGCTSQTLGYQEHYAALSDAGFSVIGVSSQPASEQHDFMRRHATPFPLLSDPTFSLASALGLATFSVGGRRFYRRIAFVVVRQVIVHVEYPIAAPADNAQQVLTRVKALSGA